MTDYVNHYPDTMLAAGQQAPDFTLFATPDQTLTLSELRGAPVLLVFYPADWSAVCTDELNVFNLALPLFREKGATILGISVDGVWAQREFSTERKLGFALLSDFEPKGEVAKRYGVYDFHAGTSKRALILIDADQTVRWSYLSPTAINPGADGALDALDALTATTGPDQPNGE